MFKIYFKKTTLDRNHLLTNTELPTSSALNLSMFSNQIKVEKGEELPVMVENCQNDSRVYYTLYKVVDGEVYTKTTLCKYLQNGVKVLPNVGGMTASEDVKRQLKKLELL